MDRYPGVIAYVICLVVSCLAAVLLAVVAVMLDGLFDARVDNHDIFALITPAFIAIVASFSTIMGSIAGYIAGKNDRPKPEAATQGTTP